MACNWNTVRHQSATFGEFNSNMYWQILTQASLFPQKSVQGEMRVFLFNVKHLVFNLDPV